MADFPVNATGATFVFTPVTGLANTLKVTNTGSTALYAGPQAAMLTPGAFPLVIAPGRELYVNPVTVSTYLSAGYAAGTSTTTLSAAAAAGTTSFTVASNTSFPAGTTLLLGSAKSSQEALVVASTTSTTVITSASASLYDHVSGATVTTATANFGQARCLTGVI